MEIEITKTKELLRCDLTPEEIKDYGDRLARKCSEIDEIEDQKKAIMSDLKSRIDSANTEKSSLARKIQNKYEFRDVPCEIRKDYGLKLVQSVRLDTGEVINERTMTADELQAGLFQPLQKGESQ